MHAGATGSATLALLLLGCSPERSNGPYNLPLEDEVAVVVEVLANGTGAAKPGFLQAVELRDEILEAWVVDECQERGLNVVGREDFGTKTGRLMRVTGVYESDGKVFLEEDYVGKSEFRGRHLLNRTGAGFKSHGSRILSGDMQSWEPLDVPDSPEADRR